MDNILFRKARERDIPVLVRLHANCMGETEMSNKLGSVFIEAFYRQITNHSTAEINVAVKGGQIFCFSIAFNDYFKFTKNINKTFLKILLKVLVRSPMEFIEKTGILLQYLFRNSKKPDIPKGMFDFHLGVIVLDPEFSKQPACVNSFIKVFQQSISFLKNHKSGYWTSAYASNEKATKFIRNFARPNYEIVIPSYPEDKIYFSHIEKESG